jgi:hypothetical protein
MLAGAAERIVRRPALIAPLGTQLHGRARRRERARRDRDGADALRPPLDREAFGHRQERRLRHRGGNGEGAAGDGRGRENGEHHTGMPGLDPALARRKRAVHRAMQRRRQDRVRRAE